MNMMTTKLIATNSMPTQLEILAMSQELLVDHYNEEKDKVLTQWREMTELVLNTTGGLIEYPELPEYPSCDEIMSLARQLNVYFTEMNGEYHAMEPEAPMSSKTTGGDIVTVDSATITVDNGDVGVDNAPVEPPAQPA